MMWQSKFEKPIANLIRFFVGASILLLTMTILLAESAAARAHTPETGNAGTLYVSAEGSDAGDCTDPAAPCQSLQRALNRAATGDRILMAAGEYFYAGPAENPCDLYMGKSVVACVVNKHVTIQGGYAGGNWVTPAYGPERTIINGGGQYRGFYVVSTEPYKLLNGGLNLQNISIQNSSVQGARAGDDQQTFAFGAGMLVDYAYLSMDTVIFAGNTVRGGSTAQVHGGSGSGGGLAVRQGAGTVHLRHVIFRENRAEGGDGQVRGGFGIGGGLFTFRSTVEADNLQFYNNVAQAGSSSGAGRAADGETADGQGGAAGFQLGSQVTLRNPIATGNQSIGGNATGEAGGGFGGAFVVEGWTSPEFRSRLQMENARITGNLARGGNGAEGGIAAGGGVESIHADMFLYALTVLENESRGGNGTVYQGPAGGGGLYLHNIFDLSSKVELHNSVIANNRTGAGTGGAVGGGGGGIWLQAIEALISHTTVAQNSLLTSPMLGSAIIVLDDGAVGARPLTLRYSILADHNNRATSALYVKPGNHAVLQHNLFAGNSEHINTILAGRIDGMHTSLNGESAHFVAPGADSYDYSLLPHSPAIGAAGGSLERVDRMGNPRKNVPDLGAFEAVTQQYESFDVRIYPIATRAVRAEWGTIAGVEEYEVTVECPDGATPPEGMACGAATSLPGSTTGKTLAGLTNDSVYTIQIDARLLSGLILRAETPGTATDNFLYLAQVRR